MFPSFYRTSMFIFHRSNNNSWRSSLVSPFLSSADPLGPSSSRTTILLCYHILRRDSNQELISFHSFNHQFFAFSRFLKFIKNSLIFTSKPIHTFHILINTNSEFPLPLDHFIKEASMIEDVNGNSLVMNGG